MTLRMLATEKSLTLLRLSLFGILTLVASPVNAQETIEAGDMLITGVFGTQSFGLEGEEGDEGEDDGGAELETAITFGGGFRYALTSRWGLEGNIQFSPTSASFEVDDIDEEGDDDDSGDDDSDDSNDNGDDDRSVNSSYYTAGVTFNLLRGRTFIPFVTAGGGGVMLEISGGGSETKLVGMFGAGVLFGVSRATQQSG